MVTIGLLAIPLWSTLSPVRQADLGVLPLSLVRSNEGWSGPLQQETTWRPSFAGADSETLATYERAGTDSVEVFIASYRLQRQDKELVGYRSHLVTEPERIITTSRVSSSVAEAIVASGARRDLVLYSYLIGDWATSSGFFAQLAYGVKSLWSAPLSRIVALRTRCGSDDCADARHRLEEFESLLQPPRTPSR
jgi:EpsI family protein